MTLTILGQLKSGKNGMLTTRAGRRYPNAKWATWRDFMVSQIRVQTPGQKPIDYALRATVRYWRGDERRRDVPGMMDAMWHCLERGGIVTDDKLFEEVHWLPMGLDRENPKAMVTMETLT